MASSNPTVFSAGRVREFLTVDQLTSAPSVTTSRLYNLNGVLYFDGVSLESGGGAGGGSLGEAYQNGAAITVSLGAITLTDGQATANTLSATKTGTGSGDIFALKFEDAGTGRGIYIDMDDGIAANALVIDSGGTARTGSDLVFTDDSTGTHICIDINSSGAGAHTGIDWTDSFAGSPAGFGFKATMGNSNGLDSTAIQIVRGTGARTAPAIDINDASTGSADIIDVDLTGVYTGDVFDFATSAASTGNVFFVNLDNGVAMTALHIEGSGVRTQPMVEMNTDATGSANVFSSVITGAISGNVMDFQMDTTSTGNVIDIDMNASVGGKAIYLDSGAAIRTAALIDILADGSGNADCFNIDESNTGSGMLFDINVSGIGSGNVIDITYSAADTGDALKVVMANNVAGGALVITGAGVRTDSIIEVTTSETGSVDGIMRMDASGVFTGHMLTLTSSAAATTGGLLHLDMDAGVAYKALTIDVAGARTAALVLLTLDGTFGATGGGTFLDLNVSQTGASASPLIDLDISGVYTGNIFDYAASAAATGTVLELNMTNAVAAKVGVITLAGTRTANAITVTDSQVGAVDVFQLDIASTSSGMVFDINVTTAFTGNVLDIVYSSGIATGEAINIDMGTNVAGSAIVLQGAGARTDDLIKIDSSSTTNASTFDINLTGAFTTSFAFDLAATGAHTSGLVSISSDSSDTGARNLVQIINDNTLATGSVPLLIQQDAVTSTNFKLMMTLGTIKIFISDQTSPNGVLSAAEGSICLNGSATGQAFWNNDGTTSWVALA